MNSKISNNVIKPELVINIDGEDMIILDTEIENKLDSKISEIENYISQNNGKGESEEVKDELYKNAQVLWKEYSNLLKDAKFNFILNKRQFKYLLDDILSKMEYDVNSVFFILELSGLIREMRKQENYDKDSDIESFKLDATQITYLYHIISKHTVRGLNKGTYLFSEILLRIGEISKVFNYYDANGKNLSTDIHDWVLTFDDSVKREEIIGEKLEPSN